MSRLKEAERHNHELNALATISEAVATIPSQQLLLETILSLLDAEMEMIRGTIMLKSADERELQFAVAHGLTLDADYSIRYQHGEGISGRVLATGEAAIVPKITEEPDFQDRLHRRRLNNSKELSFICVPIRIDNLIVGTLAVDREYDPTRDLKEDRRFLGIVASMLAHDAKMRRLHAAEQESIKQLRDELTATNRPPNFIGTSKGIRSVYLAIEQVAASNTTVLILGESGTGKELVASAIHYGSDRAKSPIVRVNCAALSESLLESELFGHEKGAFTGALQSRKGKIEEADGGTLFLDEIGDFSPTIQVKLLRVLQEREYERVGSNQIRKIDVRILVATNADLEKAMASGRFRHDLYYRINVFPIFIPPLRDRKQDILLLANHFVERYALRSGKEIKRISTSAINMMMGYHWPGNVRELENCIERAVLLASEGVIQGCHLPPTLQTAEASGTTLKGTLKSRVEQVERDMIIEALKNHGCSIRTAAQVLGATERILRYKMKGLHIDPDRITPLPASSDTEESGGRVIA